MKKISLLLAVLSSIAVSSHLSAAPSDDLLSYWTLDGNTSDTAAGGSSTDNGSFVGTASYAPSVFGQGINLSGSNYVSIPTSADLEHAGSDLSISAWFRVTTFDEGWQALIAKGENSNYRLARSSGSDQLAYAGGAPDISGGSVNGGQWHHVLAVSEVGNGTYLYIDGVEVASGSAPSLADNGNPLLLGENPDASGRQWKGGIDDVGIFGAPLSVRQVEAIYSLGSDAAYEYSLNKVMQLFDAHDSAGSVVVAGTTWQYVASDPGAGSGFVLLGGDGSGIAPSQGPTISSFNASPFFIDSGESSTLSWQIQPPFTSVVIDQGVGNVTGSTNASGAGNSTVSPTATTAYTLTATNADGSTMASATIFVDVDPTAPRINEFVADNGDGGLVDEIGEAEDWIELYAPALVDLSDYYLTDDAAVLNKWAFPAMSMSPDSYLVVFASGNNLTGNPAFLHTNFKLSKGGEYLALTRDNGSGGFDIVTEFSPGYPVQEEGFSYGLGSDGVTLGYFQTPTPNAPNGAAFQGFVEDTVFSVGRGFYDTPQTVTIATATPGASIRYTTDGSTPSSTNGTLYTSPLPISSTTTLRAMAYKTDFESTNVDTQTYLFLEDIRTQFANGAPPTPGWPNGSANGQTYDYGMDPAITGSVSVQAMKDALGAIPSMSVVTDLPNLVNSSTGIYSNPSEHGKSWERPTSLELINPDGSTGFQIDCGIRIRGGFSRSGDNPKHALRFFFRSEYGAGKLRFPLFGNQGADVFDKVDLRTSQNYSWSFQGNGSNTFLREVLGRDLQRKMGQPHTRSRYYHLYINGVYWGLYMTQERAEANYGATYFEGSKDDFDTIKSAGSSGGYNTEATDGSIVQGTAAAPGSDWADLWYQARDLNATPSLAKYMELQGLNPDGTRNLAYPVLLDVDNLIDYTLIIGYTGNYDGPLSDFVGASNNWYSVRNRELDDRGVAYFVHDGEHSLGAGGKWNGANDRINTSNGSGSRSSYDKANPAFVHFDIAESVEEYRIRFADRAHKVLFNGGLLTSASVLATMEERRQIVDDVIIAESARWGDSKRTTPYDKANWVSAVNSLTTTINGRRDDFLGHLQAADLYPSLAAPVYNQHGGPVSSGFGVTMSNSGGTIYYMADGGDPRVVGGGVNPAAIVYASGVSITAPTLLNARSYTSGNGQWSAMNSAFFTTGVLADASNVVISEVNYHPYDATVAELADPSVSDEDDFEFIEIMNISSDVVELGGASFVLKAVNDHLEGFVVEFANSTLIQPGERLLVVANAEAFAVRYPSVSASKIIGDYSNRLDNSGEWIVLQAADGSEIDDFRYNDVTPWPETADGDGPSLVLADPESNPDPSDPASWVASFDTGGSPGEMDGTPFVGNPLDDIDGDGGVALVEYLQGLSDTESSADAFPDVAVMNVGGTDYLSITFREDPRSVDANVVVQFSVDLDDWTAVGILAGSAPGPAGTELKTYRSPNVFDPELREFVRLRVTLQP